MLYLIQCFVFVKPCFFHCNGCPHGIYVVYPHIIRLQLDLIFQVLSVGGVFYKLFLKFLVNIMREVMLSEGLLIKKDRFYVFWLLIRDFTQLESSKNEGLLFKTDRSWKCSMWQPQGCEFVSFLLATWKLNPQSQGYSSEHLCRAWAIVTDSSHFIIKKERKTDRGQTDDWIQRLWDKFYSRLWGKMSVVSKNSIFSMQYICLNHGFESLFLRPCNTSSVQVRRTAHRPTRSLHALPVRLGMDLGNLHRRW